MCVLRGWVDSLIVMRIHSLAAWFEVTWATGLLGKGVSRMVSGRMCTDCFPPALLSLL